MDAAARGAADTAGSSAADRIVAELRTYIESESGIRPIEVDADLFELGVMTSLLVVELVTRLEDLLASSIDDDDVTPELFRSLRALGRFVESRC